MVNDNILAKRRMKLGEHQDLTRTDVKVFLTLREGRQGYSP